MQKIIPHIWFNNDAEEAVEFYTDIFFGGKVLNTTHYPGAGQEIHGQEPDSILTIDFSIEGVRMVALNGGAAFRPNPSISFTVNRQSKAEIDRLWEVLANDGKILMPLQEYPFSEYYGWVEDKYGVSWQLILPDENESWRPDALIPSFMFVTEEGEAAEAAMNLYTTIFPDGEMGDIARYPAGMEPNKEGAVMFANFKLCGQWFAAMDASASQHKFAFNEGVSLLVECDDQEEIDHYWEKLSADPAAEQCGWLKDAFGVSWQIAPLGIDEMIRDDDKAAANRAMEALLAMKKIDISELQKAYEGK